LGRSAERRARVLIDLAPLRRSRDLRLLVLGELVSVLGTQLTTVAVPYQVYQLTHSSLDVGLVSLAQLFPLIGGALLGGSVVDAMDRRRLLMVAQVLMAGCSAGLAVNADLGTSLATCARCRTVAGASNGHWRGGRTRHKAGYIMVWAPGHPRAGKGQYVFEHILVMEQVLGRHLLAQETEHHRNGVREDNRPKNLELWTRPQPTGIRVSDAVAWAREILALYKGVSDTSNNAQG
jgi:Transmembrane secretion effector/HNH endonuclease